MNDVVNSAKKSKRSVLRFIWAIFKSIAWGLLIGLIINCVMWHIEGYKKLITDMHNTYQQQIDGLALRNNVIAADYNAERNRASDMLKWSQRKIKTALNKAPALHATIANHSFDKKVSYVLKEVDRFIIVLKDTLNIILIKWLTIFASIWVFIFAAILGATDGLLARYIRTSEGGRESTFVFHRVSDMMLKIPLVILFLYLTIPLFLNPEMIVMMMSVVFFMFFYVATASLKKFL